MAGRNHNPPLVRHLLAFGMAVESPSAGMHGRRKHITFQPENEFAYFVVGFRSDISEFFLKVFSSPSLESPVLIVDEDAPIFHRGRLGDHVLIEIDISLSAHRNVSPPVPWIDPDFLADIKNAVCQSSWVAARYIHIVLIRLDSEAFPFFIQGFSFLEVGEAAFIADTDDKILSAGLDIGNWRPDTTDPLDVVRDDLSQFEREWAVVFVDHDGHLGQIDSPGSSSGDDE